MCCAYLYHIFLHFLGTSFIISWQLFQAEASHVHGVAIPTIDGIQNVLKYIGAQIDGIRAQVLWINLREEPVKSYVIYKYFYKHTGWQGSTYK